MITFACDILLLLPFSAATVLLLQPLLWSDRNTPQLFIMNILLAVCLLAAKNLKTRGRIWMAGTLSALLVSACLLQPQEQRLDFLLEQLWILRMAGVLFLCFIIHLFRGRSRILRLLPPAAGVLVLTVGLYRGLTVPKPAVGLVLFCLLLYLADENQRHSVKEGETDPKRHLVGISPFLLLLVIGTYFLKTPDTPYDWGFVKRAVHRLEDGIHVLEDRLFAKGSWDAASPRIGFTDRGEFADSLTRADYTAMQLELKGGADPQIYLAGKSFDSFDGREWVKTDESGRDMQGFDTLETMSAVLKREDIRTTEDLMQRCTILFSYRGLNSACLFVPAKTAPDSAVYEKTGEMSGGDLYAADGSIREYPVVYYRINRDNAIFRDMLDSTHTVEEDSWNAAREKCSVTEGYSYAEYLQYRQDIRSVYLPQTVVSGKTEDFLKKLLEGAETDTEKLLRIEALLKSWRYTDRPGELPSGIRNEADFLDHFLFEKQEGYCSHYATAFVLLARACGIPARYVQGFRVPVSGAVNVSVLSSYAHAWPEVYLEGTGWFAFEPTPGLSRHVQWLTLEERQKRWEASEDLQEDEPVLPQELPEVAEEHRDSRRWYPVVLTAAAGSLLAAVLFVLERMVWRIRYRKMDPGEKVARLCRKSLELLKRMHMARMDSETLEEFAARAGEHFAPEELAFCGICEAVFYGRKVPTEEELAVLEQNVRLLRRRRRRQLAGAVGMRGKKYIKRQERIRDAGI